MEIRDLLASEIELARQFLSTQGWAHRVGDAAAFAQLIENTQRTAVAVVDGAIVGFARGITDDKSNGYLSMVAVAPGHRRRGIGAALVAHVIGSEKGITWMLRAGRDDSAAFFASLGFVASTHAMERLREQPGKTLETE
jgi:ribosomal protein S18 acetylase RimI-like enzyme